LPKKTTALLRQPGNDFVIGVKPNQPTLFRQIPHQTADSDQAVSRAASAECNQGRLEVREVQVFVPSAEMMADWPGVGRCLRVEREVWSRERESLETSSYFSRLHETASFFRDVIRAHWGIENGLHWVKDVTLGEDASRIRTGSAPENYSLFRTLAITILRKHGYSNIAQAERLLANDVKKIMELLE
jgi:predicted transposase YbfD/YdcC